MEKYSSLGTLDGENNWNSQKAFVLWTGGPTKKVLSYLQVYLKDVNKGTQRLPISNSFSFKLTNTTF